MAAKLQDAKITVRVDTEGAESALEGMEKRLKKDQNQIKKTAKGQSDREKKGKAKRSKLLAGAKGFVKSGLSMGAIPYAQTIDFAASLIEYGGPAAITAIDEMMKDKLGDIPFADDLRESIVGGLQEGMNEVSEKITELRAKVMALEDAKQIGLDMMKSSVGLGIPLDSDFVAKHLKESIQISEAQSVMQANMKKYMLQNLAKSAGKVFGDYLTGD